MSNNGTWRQWVNWLSTETNDCKDNNINPDIFSVATAAVKTSQIHMFLKIVARIWGCLWYTQPLKQCLVANSRKTHFVDFIRINTYAKCPMPYTVDLATKPSALVMIWCIYQNIGILLNLQNMYTGMRSMLVAFKVGIALIEIISISRQNNTMIRITSA